MKNKKKTGGGKRTCERLSDGRISFEHLSTWVTVDPSKSTCQTRYCGRENLAPISRVRKVLPFRWGKGWVLGTKGGHVEVETLNVVVRGVM